MIDRGREQGPPYISQQRQDGSAAAPDDGQIHFGHGENVAEQEPHQIDPYPGHEGQDNKTDGQRRMCQQSQQRVRRQGCPPLQQQKQQ